MIERSSPAPAFPHEAISPDLCVVVVAAGDEQRVGSALAGVLARAGWLELDAVVVDTGDGRVTRHVEANFLDVRTIQLPGRSFGDACNRALESSEARYALLLSPMLDACEGDLAQVVASLDRRPELGLLGVRHLDEAGILMPSIRRFPAPRHMLAEALGLDRMPAARRVLGEHELDRRKYERETPCEWTTGFVLVRRAAFDAVGRLDPRFLRFSAEADLCLRLTRAGWGVVHSPAFTVRRRLLGRREQIRLEAQAAYARMQFARKHFPRTVAEYRWAMTLRYALRAAIHSVSRRGRAGAAQAARAALRTVVRGRAPFQEPSPL
jgi:GT2 family glycosyltransferase